MDSEFTRGCISKLLLKVAIDLELNQIEKLRFSYGGFFLP